MRTKLALQHSEYEVIIIPDGSSGRNGRSACWGNKHYTASKMEGELSHFPYPAAYELHSLRSVDLFRNDAGKLVMEKNDPALQTKAADEL